MTQHTFITVEGSHDVAFLWRLLKSLGFKKIEVEAELEPYWKPLIPKTFPHKGKMTDGVPVPNLFAMPNYSVAVQFAGGDSNLCELARTQSKIVTAQQSALDGLGILIDTDKKTAQTRFDELLNDFASQTSTANLLVWPSRPNTVSTATTRTGILILPDLTTQGSLEDLLLDECANTSYPEMKKLATTYVNDALANTLIGKELKKALKELNKVPTQKKAIVAAMVALLKSGRNTQNSINDDQWFAPEVFQQKRVRACLDFISQLTGAPIPATL
jgi:hypothetical protein